MNSLTDQQLLCGYAEQGSEAHFAELVRRHTNLVYSAALRMVCDVHLAEDVTQGAFMALARNAANLADRTCLAGWLHGTAQNLAVKAVRSDARRRTREQEGASEILSAEPDAMWKLLAPRLDEALGELSEPDRDALLMRYFENKSAREMAETLGTSEAAAQKRLNRAVERLRHYFAKRGLDLGGSGIIGLLPAKSVGPAPAGLVSTISSTILKTQIAFAPELIQSVSMINLKVAVATVILTLAISTVLLWRQNVSLKHEIRALRAASNGTLAADASLQPNDPNEKESERLRLEHLELLSLRGRVKHLTDELRERTAGGFAQAATQRVDANSMLLSASLTNRISSGDTLAVGGWSTQNGMRRYLLITPAITGAQAIPNDRQLSILSRLVAGPESFWERTGWGPAKSDVRQSTLVAELAPEQVSALLSTLKDVERAKVSNVSQAERRSGEYLGLAFSISDEEGDGVMMCIDLYPRIAADGQSVELELRPPATPIDSSKIHPSLLSAGAH